MEDDLPREGRVRQSDDSTTTTSSRNKFSDVSSNAKRYPYGLSPTRHYKYKVYKIRTERKAAAGAANADASNAQRRVAVVAKRRRQTPKKVPFNEELDTFQSPKKLE